MKFKENLISIMNLKNIKPYQLERTANVSVGCIAKILTSDDPNPTLKTLIAISNILGCSINDLTGYLPVNKIIPKYKVLKTRNYDCGLYHKYDQHITIDEPSDKVFEILMHEKGIFLFPDGMELALKIDATTISGVENDSKTVIVREIYVKSGEKV